MGAAFYLTVQGNNVTGSVPSESVRISETAGESNAVCEFDLEYSTAAARILTGPIAASKLSQNVDIQDLTNGRKVFSGNLVNMRVRHFGARGTTLHCTALSYDAWLDRAVVPTWTSKRPNQANIANDRLMVQNLITTYGQTVTGNAPGITATNTYVAVTQSPMPVVKVANGGTLRDILSAIAEAASTPGDPTARHFYVDFDLNLHYFKGNEGLTAPYRIGDASYTDTVKATSGLVSYWSLREASGATAIDSTADANTITFAGGYTRGGASGLVNEPFHASVAFNGSTGYGASVSDADLHPGNTFSVELWFKRSTLGTAQTMVSAGTDDYEIGFTAANEIVVYKEGTGNNFVTTATYTDTSWHHLMVTRTPGTTIVYVDGVSKAGTATARTFVSAGAAPINIGRRLSSTDRYFSGSLQSVAVYSTTQSAATALAHYNDGVTLVADDFEFETDVNSSMRAVYVRGGNATGTGWVQPTPFNTNYAATGIIDRPESTTDALKKAFATGYLKREAPVIYSGKATITMAASTWRAGQTLTIDNASLGIDGSDPNISQTYQIMQLETYPNMGSGVVTYEIYFGALPWSGTFAVQKKKRK